MKTPACWKWAPPAPEKPEAVRRRMYAESLKYAGGIMPHPETVRRVLMVKWQRDRCAVCGQKPATLVRDHCHWSNLFRGFICRSCNTREGITGDPVFGLWAERNPAIIFNIKVLQYRRWNPLSGRRGPDQPPHYG